MKFFNNNNKDKERPGAGVSGGDANLPPSPSQDPGRPDNEPDLSAAGINPEPPAAEITPAADPPADPPAPPAAVPPPVAPPVPATGKYRVIDSAIMFNGRLYPEGSVISLTAKDAHALKKFLAKI
ncbi:MAG: hypothetical protein RDU76_11560 [Candidatus Edwardsbacteria bacterium]|nr:hypothetical protein [Candidatus Edwardsbacteria bacterium]